MSNDHWLMRVARDIGLIADDDKPTLPARDPSAPVVATDDPAAARWCDAALKAVCDELKATQEGARADQTYRKAFRVGTLVAGGYLDQDAAVDALHDAAAATGLPQSEIIRAVGNGFEQARQCPAVLQLDPDRGGIPEAFTLDDDVARAESEAPARRTVKLTPASSIKLRPIRWVWEHRLALGTLALIGGREGIGKSTTAYQLAADITHGRLPGCYSGQAKAVVVAATEDSWEHTIAPRLIAAGADLNRVYRVDVVTVEGTETGLSLPRDLLDLEDAVRGVGAALILLDPLMSRLDAQLDTHKDAEVRLALEPLVRLADRCEATVLGLIHVNKTAGSTDALTLLMGSRAFAAVARAVLFVMVDPEDETRRLLGQPKNNLGSTDLPTLTFRIDSATVAETDEGEVVTGRIVWGNEAGQTIEDALASSTDDPDVKSATQEASEWLSDYLVSKGGVDESAAVKKAGATAGHTSGALNRARRKLKIVSKNRGYPRRTMWLIPEVDVD